MAKVLRIAIGLVMAAGSLLIPAGALAAVPPVAVFPLQDLSGGRNEVNLPFTKLLEGRLSEAGNRVVGIDTVITYMAKGRIRRVGSLESTHIREIQRELGAAYVLLGTLVQRKERPAPSLALTLDLVSTSSGAPVWTYVGAMSTGDHLKMLGVGEPQNTADLQEMLLADVLGQWPWERMTDLQQGAILLESVSLEPRDVQPGGEIRCRVRLNSAWRGDGNQQIFFQVGDQLFPAVARKDDDRIYEAIWIAGEENGRIPVNLLMRWPQYERTETAFLGSYLVDGVPPLLELGLGGTQLYEGLPVFSRKLEILPKLLLRKPIARWRLAFFNGEDEEDSIGEMEGEGDLPESFIWSGHGSSGDGRYTVRLEIWDNAGNLGQASRLVEMNRSLPQVDFFLEKKAEGMVVDLAYEGKVPIKYWRLEMWTKEGKILTQMEGNEFPVSIDIDTEDAQFQDLDGILLYQDALGKKVRRKVKNLLPKITEEKKEDEDAGLSKSWVDEF